MKKYDVKFSGWITIKGESKEEVITKFWKQFKNMYDFADIDEINEINFPYEDDEE